MSTRAVYSFKDDEGNATELSIYCGPQSKFEAWAEKNQ